VLEKELSKKKQFLDIAIIKHTQGKPITEFPDGLEDLSEHNLITYKSIQESLNTWTLDELIAYYVNYRKQESPSLKKLIPVEQFKLLAVCTHYPSGLQKHFKLEQLQQAVFNLTYGSHQIKILVLGRMPQQQRNAIWQLFNGTIEGFIYGGTYYNWQSKQDRAILNQLYEFYKQRGAVMPYTMDDFRRDYVRENIHVLSAEEILQKFSPEKRLEGLSPDEVLNRYSPEKRLEGLSPEKRLEGLSPEKRLEGLSPEKRLEGLSVEEILQKLPPEKIEAFLKNMKNQ
jgi:hypothetical protein